MMRYALTLALRLMTALQLWYWDEVALRGAAALQRCRESLIRRLL
mgnify:CR=1 FL=1